MTIQEKIKKVRKQKGWTQKQLAKVLHITQAAVGQFETNENPPKIDTLKKIAAALDVEVEYLQYGDIRELGSSLVQKGQEVVDDLRKRRELDEIVGAYDITFQEYENITSVLKKYNISALELYEIQILLAARETTNADK